MHVQNENIPFLRCLFYRFHLWLSGLHSVRLFRRTEQSVHQPLASAKIFLNKIQNQGGKQPKGKNICEKRKSLKHKPITEDKNNWITISLEAKCVLAAKRTAFLAFFLPFRLRVIFGI